MRKRRQRHGCHAELLEEGQDVNPPNEAKRESQVRLWDSSSKSPRENSMHPSSNPHCKILFKMCLIVVFPVFRKEVIVDLDSSALNKVSLDATAEREPAKVNVALQSEVLTDTAPVLEGTKVTR